MSHLDPMAFLRKVTVLANWKRLESPGSPPGTLIADSALPSPMISVISFDENEVVEKENLSLAEAFAEGGHRRVTWIDIQGLGKVDVLKELGETMDLHRLELEDVLDFSQRIKIQAHDHYSFFIGKYLQYKSELTVQQVSVFFDESKVITLTPIDSTFLHPVRSRIQKGEGRFVDTQWTTWSMPSLIPWWTVLFR